MGKVYLNPECWNCRNTTKDDKTCPKCGEHLDDEPIEEDFWDGDDFQVG